MVRCLCFRLRRGREKLRSDINKKEELSRELRRESAAKFNVDSRCGSSAPQSNDDANAAPKTPTFTYEELMVATDNFSEASYLGRGGFGAVFKGRLGESDQVVAVKQLDQSGFQGDKEFLVEVLMLSLVRHSNLVNLLGFCAEGEQRLLVYEYMPFGSLEDHLFDLTPEMEPLDWNTRIKIAAGAARGLDSLHHANPPIIYRDFKASNILLDEHFNPKLSDFGLAKFGPMGDKSHVSTRVMGTYGYCAPEYASSGKLTLKTDIYSYGVVLLELITGHRAVEEIDGHRRHLVNWALPLMKDRQNYLTLVDPLLRGQYSVSVLKKAIEVALLCLSERANLRPTSSDLVLAMDYLDSRKYGPKEANKGGVQWPDIKLSPSQTTTTLDKDSDRDRAVAEAKIWGESWREKQQQSPQTLMAMTGG